jgi:hypothetical protein
MLQEGQAIEHESYWEITEKFSYASILSIITMRLKKISFKTLNTMKSSITTFKIILNNM